MISEETFFEMVKKHDLTFEYSDDQRIWRRGCEQLDAIREAAKSLPQEVAAKVWNSVVDLKLVPEAREPFYWKMPAKETSS